MHIPQEFKLGGIVWKVEETSMFPAFYGECDPLTATIQLDSTQAQQLKEQTFCHELVHAIMYSMGYYEKPHDEKFVDGFATFLHQFLQQQ